MGLGLGEAVGHPALDEFLHREGYEHRRRLYRPVLRCWCGSDRLTPAVDLRGEFQHYQACQGCGCLLLKLVLSEQYLAELYGIRFFREVQVAIGLPPFYERYENDARDRIPVWIDILQRHMARGRVLEVGCAHGRFLKELALLGYDVVGLELDAEIAQWAREKTGVDIRGQRLETLPDRDFDAVFASDVLEHVYDPRQFIASSIAVMKPGGKAFFQTVVFDAWQDCPEGFLRRVYHTVLYSRRSVELLPTPGARLLPPIPSVFGCHMVCFEKTASSSA